MTKKQGPKDLNSEPEMKELRKIFKDMPDGEKTHTKQHLKDQEVITPFRVNQTRRLDMSERARMLKDEDGSLVEIVSCRATKCNYDMGRG